MRQISVRDDIFWNYGGGQTVVALGFASQFVVKSC